MDKFKIKIFKTKNQKGLSSRHIKDNDKIKIYFFNAHNSLELNSGFVKDNFKDQ